MTDFQAEGQSIQNWTQARNHDSSGASLGIGSSLDLSLPEIK